MQRAFEPALADGQQDLQLVNVCMVSWPLFSLFGSQILKEISLVFIDLHRFYFCTRENQPLWGIGGLRVSGKSDARMNHYDPLTFLFRTLECRYGSCHIYLGQSLPGDGGPLMRLMIF